MIVVGVDPGLVRMGLAAVHLAERAGEHRVLAWAAVATKPNPAVGSKTQQTAERVRAQRDAFLAFYWQHRGVVAVEAQVGATFAKHQRAAPDGVPTGGGGNLFKLGMAYGAVLAAAPTMPVLVMPQEVKRRLLGTAAGSKEQVWAACEQRLGQPGVLLPGEPRGGQEARWAVRDAVAVALAVEPEVRRVAALAPGATPASGGLISP